MLHLGSSVCPAAGDAGLLVVLMTAFKYTRYILVPQPTTIHMLLHQEANQRDIIQAYLQVGRCCWSGLRAL